jgi:molybdopterin-containing oxidoreductase family iron-sulfur binding subunit
MTQAPDQSRRAFLAAASAVTGLALAPGVTLFAPAMARPVGTAASDKVRWGLLINLGKLDDGGAKGVAACSAENGWTAADGSTTDARWIRTVKVSNPANETVQTLPMMCQHCAEPPCVDVCPTGASMKRADGIVLVDKHTCIGCRYCVLACPYGARSFIHEPLTGQRSHAPRGKGTVESCTMCVHRVDADQEPACVEAYGGSKRGAMVFGDLNDPQSDISKQVARYATQQVRTDLGTRPGIWYRGLA